MQIEIPDISPAEFGKMVLSMLQQVTTQGVRLELLALQHIAIDLANGNRTIIVATEQKAEDS